MVHTITVHGALASVGRFLEHAAAIVVGLIMMIVGLALGVTMIMLPVGITIGLLGVAMLVAGVFARIDEQRS
jgi:membrane-bound ClpP family serine protease